MPPVDSALAVPPSATLFDTLRKYFNIFRVSLIERMAYRGDFLLGTILRFFPMITTILLWQAVFAGAAAQTADDGGKKEIAGFSEHDMIAYLLLVHVSRMFSSMPGLSGTIAQSIRDGTLKKYLLQPLDMIGYLVSYRAAHKVAYIATSALPYGIVFFLCAGYFDEFPSLPTLAAYLVTLILAFLVGFFFECTMGMIGFWFLEITSLLWVVNTINFFVSGQMFPLDLLPGWSVTILKALPFQYLAYFPAAVFLGKVQGAALWQGLLTQAGWALAMIALARWLYGRGLRHYGAYGG
jgi:ABC-2 type transport system permease protein